MITIDDISTLSDSGNYIPMLDAIQNFVWYEDGLYNNTEKELDTLITCLKAASDEGHSDAMNMLGALYAEGRFIDQNSEQAFLWYKKASEHGNALATSNLGFCYMYGNGTERNYEKAYKAFSKAALLDIGDAIVRLGDMYMFGNYVEKDEYTALKLYSKAVDMATKNLQDWGMQQVYSDATRRIGDCYYYGNAVKKDISQAIIYYAEALHYYKIRENRGDSYSSVGYEKTKNRIKEALMNM